MNTAPIISKVWSFCTTPSWEGWPEGPGWVSLPVRWFRSWMGQPTPSLTRHPSWEGIMSNLTHCRTLP